MADIHTWTGTACANEIALTEERLRLYIFPNKPQTAQEQQAFSAAVAYQLAHEKSRIDQKAPDGVTSFRIGNFSMTFKDGMNSPEITRQTICPAARSVLLRAGLLYRGLEGRMPLAD